MGVMWSMAVFGTPAVFDILRGCCHHANDLNDRREKKNLPRYITVEFGELKDSGSVARG